MATRASAKILRCASILEHSTVLSVPFNYCFRQHMPRNVLNLSNGQNQATLAVPLRSLSCLSSNYESQKQVLDIGTSWSVRQQRKAHSNADIKDEALCTEGDEGDFNRIGISPEVQDRLKERGINFLFPVQYKAYEHSMAGNDVIIQARTGTGKTLSFALPLVEKLLKKQRSKLPKVLVLTPTRELANQITADFTSLSRKLKVLCIVGGKSYTTQINPLRNGVDVVIGTPGRVFDLMSKHEVLCLDDVEHIVLDEVDAMLDMGFKDAVEDIIKECYEKEPKPQTMLYSATMPTWVLKTAKRYLSNDYQFLNLVDSQATQTSVSINQYAIRCHPPEHVELIRSYLSQYAGSDGRAIVFCETKVQVDRIAHRLGKQGRPLHGDISQRERDSVLYGFKKNYFQVLVCTNVAARGLDIPDVQLVIQTSPPNNPADYIHRVGRTGRAGKDGTSVLFYDDAETYKVHEIEKISNVKITTVMHSSKEMIEISLKKTIGRMGKVPKYLMDQYREIAELMIEQKDATELLTASIIAAAEIDTKVNKSLLTGKQGFRTLQCATSNKHDIKELLAQHDILVSLKHVKDQEAVVFDVRDSSVGKALEVLQHEYGENVTLLEDNLPDLVGGDMGRQSRSTYNNRDFYNNRNSSNYNSNNSYGSNKWDRSSRSDNSYRSKSFDRSYDQHGYSDYNRGKDRGFARGGDSYERGPDRDFTQGANYKNRSSNASQDMPWGRSRSLQSKARSSQSDYQFDDDIYDDN